MLKNYILSFLSIELSKLLVIPTIAIFILIFIYPKNPLPILKIVLIVLAIWLGGVMAYNYYKKYELKKKLRNLKNADEYDTAVMLGKNFLAEDRMLVYQNKDIFEESYDAITRIYKEDGKKGNVNLRCVLKDKEVIIPTGSLLQAQRTVAFLKRKNNSLVLENIEPSGDGKLHTIDQIKMDA